MDIKQGKLPLPFASKLPTNYAMFAGLVRQSNLSLFNLSLADLALEQPAIRTTDQVTSIPAIKVVFYCVYIIIFLTGMSGNILVCFVVFRNRAMHTVTNLFISNLALSDILLCMFAVPFTPMYYFMGEWFFGKALCHFLPFAQCLSVYISALTLMAIAIDRYVVILYPFKARLRTVYCVGIIFFIWGASCLLTLPYGIYMGLNEQHGHVYCEENWPSESFRRVFGFTTSASQFIIPFAIISFCYMRVCMKLRSRARLGKPGMKSLKKEEQDRERANRTNRMLILMVFIFGISWLPLNVYNLVVDFYIPAAFWEFLNVFYFMAHAPAMASTCYNPLLYAWMNDNFRKEFKTVLPSVVCDSDVATPRPADPSLEPAKTLVRYNSETDTVRLQLAAATAVKNNL